MTIQIYSAGGQLVATAEDRLINAGRHEVSWRGAEHTDLEVPSGVYFCRMVAGDFVGERKLLLLR